MPIFRVEITEILSSEVMIDADNYVEAKRRAEEKIATDQIVLTADNLLDTKYDVYNMNESCPNIAACRDFPLLCESLPSQEIYDMEFTLTKYLSNKSDYSENSENVPPVVCWYENLWSTQDLIDHYKAIYAANLKKLDNNV